MAKMLLFEFFAHKKSRWVALKEPKYIGDVKSVAHKFDKETTAVVSAKVVLTDGRVKHYSNVGYLGDRIVVGEPKIKRVKRR